MKLENIKTLFLKYKETNLSHRYITNSHIEPLFKKLEKSMVIKTIGKSVLNRDIYGITIGNGVKKIFMWSQMHGNESTTTKALFDLLNTLTKEAGLKSILDTCTLYIIPILNPDGANAYTRINANEIDLNRDAQNLTQPESHVLRSVFNEFKPHFCYNLHGQRTIFSAGDVNKIATVSFLAPAQDKNCTITPNRKIAMEVIAVMNKALQKVIPNQVGVYDDAFNINCVGDTFQSKNVPTILFEAGHYKDDYAREETRKFIYMSLLESLHYISKNEVKGNNYKPYLNIPENAKCFYDIIIRNAKLESGSEATNDIAILYKEKLIDGKVNFMPKIEKIENLNGFYGHREIDVNASLVVNDFGEQLKIGNENVLVIINNEKKSLLIEKN